MGTVLLAQSLTPDLLLGGGLIVLGVLLAL
jgi:hypothetical protein